MTHDVLPHARLDALVMRVLVTGPSGFVGRAAMRTLARDGRFDVRPSSCRLGGDWRADLEGIDAIVHTAGRAHVIRESAADPEAEYRRINVDGTAGLARQAAEAGVRRFVYLSSIKVNGESTRPGEPFRATDAPAPEDAYGRSKQEAEQVLREISGQSSMTAAIIRPVMVYGPGVKANFAAMLQWLRRGIPLPLASVDNRRSLVGLDNLIDLIATSLVHPNAANQTLLVSDGDDLSTPALLRRAAVALGTRARLFPMPPPLLMTAGRAVGRGSMMSRLCGNLQVDIADTRRLLDWIPPSTVDGELRRTAAALQERGA